MRRTRATLEDVFLELTTEEKQLDAEPEAIVQPSEVQGAA